MKLQAMTVLLSSVLVIILCLSVMPSEAIPSSHLAADADGINNHSIVPHRRTRRGFKDGAADRFAHGFGKRSSSKSKSRTAATVLQQILSDNVDDDAPSEYLGLMTDEVLAMAISRDYKLALGFVQQYVDINDDGLITEDELMI